MKDLIITGKQVKPIHMILHSEHGVGKTTFGKCAPKPIFITGEELEEIDSPRFPKCTSWDDFIKYLTYIKNEDHKYKTLIIDTLDSIESLLWKHILEDDNSKDMATARGGYGKSYTYATQLFTDVRDNYLVPIRENKKMNIILLCHTTKNKFEDPLTQSSYDIYEMKLHKNSKGIGAYSVFSEWVSIIAFAKFEIFKIKDNKTDKDYAIGDGKRVMLCTPKPAYDAKNRFNLPDELPLSWTEIESRVKSFYSDNKNPEVKELKNEINNLLEKVNDEKIKKMIVENLKSVGNDLKRLKDARKYIQGVV